MKLAEIVSTLPHRQLIGAFPPDLELTGLAVDSRRVTKGDVFVAVAGVAVDSHAFAPAAVAQGAVAVVGERPVPVSVPQIVVANSRRAVGLLAAAFMGFPARRLTVVGVTGTDGKTTTCTLLAAILRAVGHGTGLITTVGAELGDSTLETGLHTTTPDALEMQSFLRQIADAGMTHAVIEATSHGLAQERTAGCDFDVAVVTNITHDHLDFHGTRADYVAAKAKLFAELSGSQRKTGVPKVSVLNRDDSSYELLRNLPADQHSTYGLDARADVWASGVELLPAGISFIAHGPQGETLLTCPLPGLYNVYNCLAATATATALGVPPRAVEAGLRSTRRIVGRMDPVDLGQPFKVIIDFAHTPNSMEQVLTLARTMTDGKLTVVFGCAGLRDVEKRPIMGEISGRLADRVVITSEDPRTEDIDAIMGQIAAGCRQAGRTAALDYWCIADRGEAIDFAIHGSAPGDLVIITGKGHERSMCVGEVEHPWSDHTAAAKSLRSHL